MNFIDPNPPSEGTSICHYPVVSIAGTWWVDREAKPFEPIATKEEVMNSSDARLRVDGVNGSGDALGTTAAGHVLNLELH